MAVRDAAEVDLPAPVLELVLARARSMWAASGGELSPAEAEERVQELSQGLGGEMLGLGLSQCYGRQEGPERPCECGARQRFVSYRGKQAMTVLGAVRYERAYYHCTHCGAGYHIGDEALGLEGSSYSVPAQEAIALVCCHVPFAEACALLRRLSAVEVSNTQAQRLTEGHGQELEQALSVERAQLFVGEVELAPAEAPSRLYVTLDGLKLPFVDAWHEAKLGSVYEVVPGEDGIDQPTTVTHVCGAWEGPEPFGERLYQEAARRGVERTAELIAIADGAPWIWNLVAEHFTSAVQILDYYHAAERVHEVARVVYGEGSARARAWAEARCQWLWDGGVDRVLRSLRALRPAHAEGRETVRQALGYFTSNRQRMDYPSYRARGYHVGSGVVEAACKTVAAARCKRSGMRWSREGAQAVLNLRCLFLNGRWDHHRQPCKRVA